MKAAVQEQVDRPLVIKDFPMPQHRIIGSIIGTRRDQAELLDLAIRNNIRPVTEVYPLGDVNKVHDRLRQKKVRLRAVLKPS